jgi:hypothetical protein
MLLAVGISSIFLDQYQLRAGAEPVFGLVFGLPAIFVSQSR